jgi:DNA-binding NarL/FixJ family response regulator
VKVHLKNLLHKIRVDNRTQAAIWALSNLPEPGAAGFV